MTNPVLIVEDEKNLRRVLVAVLEAEGYPTIAAENAEEALGMIQTKHPALVLSDQRLPGLSGTDLLRRIKEAHPEIPVIISTAYGEIEQAVEAIKAGAEHYLTKPVDEGELIALIRQTLARHGESLPPLHRELRRYGLIGVSRAIETLLETIDLVAPAPSNVLITGESGTGKELVARALHQASPRAEQPFVAFNCGAIPLELVESEIFGYERGAFTGATRAQAGKLEMAASGTLFLDEVGDMPLPMQVKMLRALQEREFTRLGTHQPQRLAARIVAATHVDLAKAVSEGHFREDLYYRLNVIPLLIPPLRQRQADIAPLVHHFLRQICTVIGRDPMVTIAPDALAALEAYEWPGNIRQLENLLERMVVLNRHGHLQRSDLPTEIARHQSDNAFPTSSSPFDLPALERQTVLNALEKTRFNQSQAAVLLGISRKQLRTKMKNIGLLGDQDGEDDTIDT
ncbi:sigma-54 dependent transcriptional regulator [Acidithiobacillus ferriphilus]|jgi:two component, sigma54 specific, transcriptional regulator, Fis family|uniref:Sigma-54 dependent transcriptional regulator n=3 Tax=Acidithiobacillus TaxID=119977 RepID=A0ABU6FM36_9PROT|nr:sigma-54 dependent transcriptional regulator [Acidithiobacillus ferriphilus]MDA8181941.1 sigma-54 dependent transcriptional regulator [Acidithiobacillus sp.]MEB8486309.1 sigma-54 dependent transcriptional regulator [Acidithiobacillus ferriphilus]MEB8488567.1 sigma-54 dependent transcriptional regulator [Acidithiobacillus ferriphilus]MEB8494341.1 sigma-54 dependent transcriptional regulator [Acidithiobacillus ferriphilus]MEB8513104.1 sigma-54 dependent transcriptional regulator [Acidithiobac